MNKALLYVFFLFLSLSLNAQKKLLVTPSAIDQVIFDDLSDISKEFTLHVTLENKGDQPLNLIWRKSVLSQPLDWLTEISDKNNYYLPESNSNIDPDYNAEEAIYLAPGEVSDINFHIFPFGSAGDASYKMVFLDETDPNKIIAETSFDYSIQRPIMVGADKASLKLFPNPSTNYIELPYNTIVSQIDIYNTIGRKIQSFKAENGQQYDISTLPTGLYLVSLVNSQGSVIKTLRFFKRNFHP
ncbi:MAG: T9SS type A sorting domain-containing protein [Saprospiraceae bacterium]